jgi:hypothetical protein
MNIPTKAHAPEWSPSDNVIFYYTAKGGEVDLTAKAKRLRIPKWLNDLIAKETERAHAEGRAEAKKEVRRIVNQLVSI